MGMSLRVGFAPKGVGVRGSGYMQPQAAGNMVRRLNGSDSLAASRRMVG